MSVGNWFQRKGAVNVNDLLVIRREEGLDGRIRETAEEDLVLTLECIIEVAIVVAVDWSKEERMRRKFRM